MTRDGLEGALRFLLIEAEQVGIGALREQGVIRFFVRHFSDFGR